MTKWVVEFHNPLDSHVIFNVTPELEAKQKKSLVSVADEVLIMKGTASNPLNEDIIQCVISTDSDDVIELKHKINQLQLNYAMDMWDTEDYLCVPGLKSYVRYDE